MADDKWAEAHVSLCNAAESAKAAGMTESEMLDVINDVWVEDPAVYKSGGPKPIK